MEAEGAAVELHDYLRALRKRWTVLPVLVLVMLAVAAAAALLTPKTYQSRVQFFVSTVDNDNASQLAQASNFLQQRVKSYAQLLQAPIVLQPVINELKLNTTAGDLADQVSASIPTDSVLIDVTVTDRSPKQAQRIAEAVGNQFPATISDLETVGSKTSPVKVTLTQNPTLESKPVSPRPLRYLAVGLAVGLVLGVVVALAREALDTKLRTEDDVQVVANDIPVIGTIPFDNDARRNPLLREADMQSTRAESFRSLRTNLQFLDVAHHPRTIVTTSTLPGEGKTTTTANLALVLAESGAKVCLIEGDLRRPKLLEYLGMEGVVGLTDALIGLANIDDTLQPHGRHKLDVLGAGQIPPNPSELLGSPAMEKLLGELEERYDYVLIDAPPLLPVTDAAVLGTLVGGAVIVSGSGLVTRDQFRRAIGSLQAVNAHILGVVLNRVSRDARAGGYYYDYSYAPRKPSGRMPVPNWDQERPSDSTDSSRATIGPSRSDRAAVRSARRAAQSKGTKASVNP